MAENKKSFVIYVDIINTVEKLADDEAGRLFKHLLRYVNDEHPEAPDKLTDLVFEPIKQQLKRDLDKYEAKRHQYSEAGKASAEAKRLAKEAAERDRSTNSTNVESRSTNSTVNVNDSVSVNDNVSVNDSVKKKRNLKSKIKEECAKIQQSQNAIAPAMTAVLKPDKFKVPKGNWDLFVTIYNDFLKGRGLPEILRYPNKTSDEYTAQAKDLHDLKLIYEKLYPLCNENHLKVTQSFQVMFEKWHLLNKFTQDFIQPGQIYSQLTNIIDQLKNFKSRNMTDAQKKTEEAWNNVNTSKLLDNGKK